VEESSLMANIKKEEANEVVSVSKEKPLDYNFACSYDANF
jgi:hypothetical protein